jgi:hypothetical protein
MMTRSPMIIIALLASLTPVMGQDAAPTPAPSGVDASSIILAKTPAQSAPVPLPSTAAAPHADSTAIDAAISSGIPAYNPGASSPKLNMVTQEPRDTDKPKNQIPRLPMEMMSKYVVHGARLPVFRNRDLYTKAGLIDLSFKAHPGLRIGNFFGLNSGLAYEAALNDQKMSDRQDLVDTAFAMAAGGDAAEAEAVQDAIIDESFRSATQAGPVGGSPSTR